MNAKYAKRIRKTVNEKIRMDLEHLMQILSKERYWVRLKFAFRLAFGRKVKAKFRV